jgi:DNA-binding PadR family transcriptional regulator
MSVRHAVLGLVIERPGYGYQLGQRLEERCGAWGWVRSGVYPALNSLEHDDYVRPRGEKGAARRGAPRVIYEATDRGVDFFEGWISGPSPPSPSRQELDLKLLFARPEDLPQMIDQTRVQEQQCITDLKALTSAMQIGSVERMSSWQEAGVVLQRDGEIMLLQARIEWLQDVRKTMWAFCGGRV